jgi:hypothetical protein
MHPFYTFVTRKASSAGRKTTYRSVRRDRRENLMIFCSLGVLCVLGDELRSWDWQ